MMIPFLKQEDMILDNNRQIIPGAKIEVNGINFLLNETTARNIKPGLIAQDQCDTEKWIPVNLP